VTDRVAKELISMKSNDILQGKGNRDVMSLLSGLFLFQSDAT